MLAVAQDVDDGLCGLGRVNELHGLVVRLRNQSVGLGSHSQNAYTRPRAFYHYIRLHEPLAWSILEIVVAAHKGKLGHLDEACQVLESIVKLVVAQRAGIVSHLVHQSHLHLAPVEVIIGRPLAEIATVEQQQFGALLSQLLDQCGAAHETALVGLCRVAEVLGYRLHA